MTGAENPRVHRHREWLRRLQAAALDFPIILAWAAFSGMIGGILRLLDLDFDTPTAWDVFAFATMVLPVVLTLTLMEASPRQATPGKRRNGLLVTDAQGRRLTFGRSFARSAAKLLPWQMAHTAVFQLVAGSTALRCVVLSITAQALVVASITTMAIDSHHRSFHDLITGTRVVRDDR